MATQDNNPFTVKKGIEVQQRHLKMWKKLLKPKVFNMLKEEVEKDNDKAVNGYDIARGQDIDEILQNHISVIL